MHRTWLFVIRRQLLAFSLASLPLLTLSAMSHAAPPPCACGDDLVPGLDISFPQGRYQLTDQQRETLRRLAGQTRDKVGRTLTVIITAYLDTDRRAQSPLALAEQRTRAVKVALVAQGLPHTAIIERTEVAPRSEQQASQVQISFAQLANPGPR